MCNNKLIKWVTNESRVINFHYEILPTFNCKCIPSYINKISECLIHTGLCRWHFQGCLTESGQMMSSSDMGRKIYNWSIKIQKQWQILQYRIFISHLQLVRNWSMNKWITKPHENHRKMCFYLESKFWITQHFLKWHSRQQSLKLHTIVLLPQ